jgi:Flp pilus assembly protein TadD
MRSISRFATAMLLAAAVAGCSADSGFSDASRQDARIGEAELKAGNPDAALRLADETLLRYPNDVGALTRRGTALTGLGRLDEARENLQKAVSIQPRDIAARLALGRVQLPVDPQAAEASFQEVLRQDGQNAAAWNNLGIARDLQGHHAEAAGAYRKAIAAAPEMAAARVNLALSLAILGQGQEAIGLLRPLAEQPGATRKVRENYAAVLAMTGDRQAAENILSANMPANELAPAVDVLASLRTPGNNVTR